MSTTDLQTAPSDGEGPGPRDPAMSIDPTDTDHHRSGPTSPARRSAMVAAVSGVVAAAGALAAGELAASFAAPRPGPVIAVANRVVDEAPTWFVEFGKAVFGLDDKPALIAGTILLSLLFGAGLGLVARRRPALAAAGFAAFGLLGLVSIAVDAQGSLLSAVVVSTIAVVVGVSLLRLLPGAAGSPGISHHAGSDAVMGSDADLVASTNGPASEAAETTVVTASPTDPPVNRRRFLGYAGLVGAAGAVAAVSSREIRGRSSAELARSSVELVDVGDDVGAILADAATGPVAEVPGISPLVVANDDFYLIDTALVKPQVNPANWSMSIVGMVDNELTFSYDDLLERAQTIAPVTLSCVSNEVGGNLVGNAVWQGVPLVELLDEAGVQPGATQIASRSVDGWTCGFPTEAAYDGRTALVAVGMNGEPLPVRHGFPARLVVSGLYGYVSATKWLSEISLTTLEDFDGYWIPRGWSKLGPVKTQSRIDTPRNRSQVAAGSEVAVAGVAWAPDLGVERVEVRFDGGPWIEATLGESMGPDAWVQWVVPWTPEAGSHVVEVRATDGSGTPQTEQRTQPAPNGASGWHTIEIEAT